MYPVYKLIRAINRQYPNNGFISAVDVTEETNDGLIPEDFRDLLNETIQEIYHDIAIDEIFSFPTVPGQKEYALPEDRDLRDIQEVVRTFARRPYGPPPPHPGPVPPEQRTCAMMFDANGGTGEMEPVVVNYGTQYVLPDCTFTPPEGKTFIGWGVDGSEYAEPPKIYEPGEAIDAYTDTTISAVWEEKKYHVTIYIVTYNGIGYLHHKLWNEPEEKTRLVYDGMPFEFDIEENMPISSMFEVLSVYDDLDTNLCLDATSRVITEDTDIGVAVPTTIPEEEPAEPIGEPDPEEPLE